VQVLLDLARQGKGTFHRDVESADDGADADRGDGIDEGDAKYLNVSDRFGDTPLQLAVEENREAMIQFLVSKGAGAHTTQRTPARLVCSHLRAVCRDMLGHVRWRVGVDINHSHRTTGLTPLHWTVQHDKMATARLLLELGAANEPVRSANHRVLASFALLSLSLSLFVLLRF